MGHIHADLMAQYAEDAKQHDKPWELWQFNPGDTWAGCPTHPRWVPDFTYRRKPRTVQVGDIEVPETCKVELEYGQDYIPLLTTAGASLRTWNGDKQDTYALKSNLVHLDFQSAEIHAKALIEVSKGWWK